MTSPKIESTETRLTTKGLFPILNTLGKGRQDVWDKSYKAAQAKLAADTPTGYYNPGAAHGPISPTELTKFKTQVEAHKTAPPVAAVPTRHSEFKVPDEIAAYLKRLPDGYKLQAGATPSEDKAYEALGQHVRVWQSPEAAKAVEGLPYNAELLRRMNSGGVAGGRSQSSLQETVGLANEGVSVASPAALGFPGWAGQTAAIAAPILSNSVASNYLPRQTAEAVAPNFNDVIPLARVANAESAYQQAHTAYSQLPKTAPYETRKAAYEALTQAQKSYADSHDAYSKSIVNGGFKLKGKEISANTVLPDLVGGVQDKPLSQQGMQEASGTNASSALDVGRSLAGAATAAVFPEMAGLTPAIYGGGELAKRLVGNKPLLDVPNTEDLKGGVDAMAGALPMVAPGLAANPAALKTWSTFAPSLGARTMASRVAGIPRAAPIAVLANSLVNALKQNRDFNALTPEQQEAVVQQRLLDESVRSANRTGWGEVGDATTRGLGYLATGDLGDASTYIGGKTLDKDNLRSVASEVAAKRFENQKERSAVTAFAQDPVIKRYAGFESAPEAARHYQNYLRRQDVANTQEAKGEGTSQSLKLINADNAKAVQAIAQRLGKMTPQQLANLNRVVQEYGADTITRMWQNVPQTLILDDLARSQPVASAQ